MAWHVRGDGHGGCESEGRGGGASGWGDGHGGGPWRGALGETAAAVGGGWEVFPVHVMEGSRLGEGKVKSNSSPALLVKRRETSGLHRLKCRESGSPGCLRSRNRPAGELG